LDGAIAKIFLSTLVMIGLQFSVSTTGCQWREAVAP